MRRGLVLICTAFILVSGTDTFFDMSDGVAIEKTVREKTSPHSGVDLAAGILDAGKLKHTAFNNGLLGTWGWTGYIIPDLPAGWYKGYGYLADFNIWIGIPEGPWTATYTYWDREAQDSLSMTGPTVSEAQLHGGTSMSDWDPTPGSLGRYHSGEVTIGDIIPGAPLSSCPLMATTVLPESWPTDEHGNRYWPGPWAADPETGQEMEGVFTADKEVFCSFTDDGRQGPGDVPFASRDELTDQGYPIGVQVDAWGLSYDRSYAEDFLFFSCKLINTSDWHYTGVYVGFYFDADVEEYDVFDIINDRMDWMDFVTREWEEQLQDTIDYNMAYIYDYRPEPNWRPFVGVKLLETPEGPDGRELGLTDWHWFEWENRPGVVIEDRRELIQYKVMSGDNSDLRPEEEASYFHKDAQGNLDPHFDSAENIKRLYPNGTDCVFLMSSGPFEWAPHETTSFSFCLIMGDNEEDLKHNARTAQGMYNYNYLGQEVTVLSPNGGEVWSGIQEIAWEAESVTGNPITEIDLFHSRDAGATWDTIAVGEENDGAYKWNTIEVPDGVRYVVKIFGTDGYLSGVDNSDSMFTINNPGDAAPEVVVLSPNRNDIISGLYTIRWYAGDADGDRLSVSIEYSPKGGGTWEVVAAGLENTGSFLWDTKSCANSNNGLIRVIAEDPSSLTAADTSDTPFRLRNERRTTLPLEPLSGTVGNGYIWAVVIDSTALTGHRYIVSFDDSTLTGTLCYDVFDEHRGAYVLRWKDEIASEDEGDVEGPIFDGLRLSVRNWDEVVFWPDSSNIELGPNTDVTNMSFHMLPFARRPADYALMFTETGDTSSNNVVTPFEIWNVTENVQPRFEVKEDFYTGDKVWQDGELIRLWEENMPTWDISLFSEPDTLSLDSIEIVCCPPETIFYYTFGDTFPLHTGDQIIFKTKRPFVGGDRFSLQTWSTAVEDGARQHRIPGSCCLYPNHPNPFNPSTDIRYQISGCSCPLRTTLKIYNILGQEVRVLVDDVKEPKYYVVTWDGTDRFGNEMASGIYFYRLTAGEFTATRRMLLLK